MENFVGWFGSSIGADEISGLATELLRVLMKIIIINITPDPRSEMDLTTMLTLKKDEEDENNPGRAKAEREMEKMEKSLTEQG